MCSSFSVFFNHYLHTLSNNGHFNIPDKTAIIIMMEQPTSDGKFYRLSCCIDRFHFDRLAKPTHYCTQFFFYYTVLC